MFKHLISGNTILPLIIVVICTANLISGTNVDAKFQYKEKYIEVPIDHFGYTSQKTFQLRYLINDTYCGTKDLNAPILFYTGNEGDITLFAENTGFMWEAAQQLKALIIFAEHRYYGNSLPFGNKSLDSPEHSGYLTAEQALADYAQLLDSLMNKKYDQPVIAVGGSYGGMLAAWFRMKYPHIVTGALAASAPILQFTGLTPCNIYGEIVSSVFKTAFDNNQNCVNNIKNSWNLFKNYSTTDGGRATLSKKFSFCQNLTKAEDINKFFDYLEDVYGNLAMANYPYETSFLAPLPAYPVRQFCSNLNEALKDDNLLEGMFKAISVYSNYKGQSKCLNYDSAYDQSMGTAAWEFQTCTEMVMPMCFKGENNIFQDKEWNFKDYSDKCEKKFNVRPKEHEIVIRYGGKNIGFASNIIFSNGLSDPWSGGGVLKYINDKITTIIIPEGAHHIDLRESHHDDPASVRHARREEINIMKFWITDFFTQSQSYKNMISF